MNYETYLNLIRSIDRRIIRGRVTGDWKEVSELITERNKLINEWRLETSSAAARRHERKL
jgi:hypothetical protein